MKLWRFPSIAYPGEVRTIRAIEFPGIAEKMAMMRAVIDHYGLGPPQELFREVAVEVFRAYGVQPRDPVAQAQALCHFMQGLYYLGEGGEVFQMPDYTLRHGYSDCDCQTMALGALLESIKIPTRLDVLGWADRAGNFEWRHVFLRAGLPPGSPQVWAPLETTIRAKPGFDPVAFAERLTGRPVVSALEGGPLRLPSAQEAPLF